ncbi:hypothetical protein, partial [Bacillus smithii]|uniref:hypothetical protein n=3 Tax=Bacillus smithii TaxID=1479 RepID=UPI002E217A76|nr:hypothetical protein [Bacillus smithii]
MKRILSRSAKKKTPAGIELATFTKRKRKIRLFVAHHYTSVAWKSLFDLAISRKNKLLDHFIKVIQTVDKSE